MNDSTITIYNCMRVNKVDVWTRTVISGVSVVVGVDKAVSTSGVITRSQVMTVIIPDTADAGGKEYASDYSEPAHQWTLSAGNNKDLIIEGECEKDITSKYTISKCKDEHSKSGIISGVYDYTDMPALRHFKVVCK